MSIIDNYQSAFDKAVEHFRQDIATLKTGRANPAVLDHITVEAYGVRTPLSQLSSIAVPEARSIVIQPWDKNILKDIEKAIRDSDIGLNPGNEGDRIRLVIPQMTEEMRKEIVKILNTKMEQARVTLRAVRDEAKEEILTAEKNKAFGEDEKFRLLEELDKKISEFNDSVKSLGAEKEKEIMTI